jgi:hypothetical protein
VTVGHNTSSPVSAEPNPSEITVPSVPSTPDSLNKEEDFFMTARFGNGSTRSLPERNGPLRNISWNPKVQFFDVYPSNEYDRRGDIATCNRLTPMLAQQIKEELNSFKMVFVPSRLLWRHMLTRTTGDGSPRNVQATHALLLSNGNDPTTAR